MTEVGAVKVKDGLFFGDASAAQDLEFVSANKVARIVNCASREVMNQFETFGVEYLSFPWSDNDGQVILDASSQILNEVMRFIDESLDQGLSVLIHSFRGKSRCVTLVTAYLMRKYKWTTNKALQYVQSRRSEIGIKPAFHRQLLNLERKLGTMLVLSSSWDKCQSLEDQILCNTFLNSKTGPGEKKEAIETPKTAPATVSRKIVWTDHGSGDSAKLERASDASGSSNLGMSATKLRSCLKRSPRVGRINFASTRASPVSTAESSPVPAILRPFIRFQSPTLGRPMSADLASPKINFYPQQNLLPQSQSTRVLAQPRNMYLRQPSPMISRSSERQPVQFSLRPASPARDVRPLTSIRPPSPVRMERPSAPSLNPTLSRPALGQPGFISSVAPRVAITALPGRRPASPMTRALTSGPLRPMAGLRRS